MALTSGTRPGPYEVTAQIGVSGMGEVHRATDSSNARVARREFVRTALGMLAVAPFAARALAQDIAPLTERIEFRRLVAANRVLAREAVVDAFGHVSVRDPENASRYVMAPMDWATRTTFSSANASSSLARSSTKDERPNLFGSLELPNPL